MKQGRTLQGLAAELRRQVEAKRDYVADTRALDVWHGSKTVGGDSPEILLGGINGGIGIKPLAHGQLSEFTGIDKRYYDRMLLNAPQLLVQNVNHWLHAQPKRRMVRTLDGDMRAFLSDGYRPLDSADLAEATLGPLTDSGATVVSCEITDQRFYLKATSPRITGEVKKGDVVQAGVVISNSEVGYGAIDLQEFDYRLTCLNGMIGESLLRKTHVSRGAGKLGDIEDAREFFKDETRQADDKAFWLKVRDVVAAAFDPARFNRRLDKYRVASLIPIVGDPVKVVELVATRRLLLTEGEKASVLTHLIRGGDLSAWGLANAVTRTAEDVPDYDRATELEAAGRTVIELPANDFILAA